MKNTKVIQFVFTTACTSVAVVISIILLGMSVPTFMSIIISMTSEFTFNECIGSQGFWVASVVCTIIAATYVRHEFEKR